MVEGAVSSWLQCRLLLINMLTYITSFYGSISNTIVGFWTIQIKNLIVFCFLSCVVSLKLCMSFSFWSSLRSWIQPTELARFV